MIFRNKEEEERALKAGVKDLHKIWTMEEGPGAGEVLFFASGVTSGDLLPGIETGKDFFAVHSLILREGGEKLSLCRRFGRKAGP